VVRPDGRVKVVNHPEGGRVAAIHVREGDLVTEGQVLVELDPAMIGEEVGKKRAEWISAEFQVVRLDAEAAGRVPDFDPALAAERPDLVAAEISLYRARAEALTSKRAQADEVVRQREQEVTTLEGRARQQKESLEILRDQVDALRKLKEQGYFPELRYLTVLRELSDAEGQLAETLSQLESAHAALAQAREARVGIDREWQSQVQAELSQALARRDLAKSNLAQSDTALRNLVVLAPADGVVQELKINNLGQAVAPNQEMMKIVPVGDTLIVEAKVANADISKIEVGQAARVKITTYNYVRYGVLEGKVEQISPDATKDEKTGQLLFAVWVRTEKNYLGEEAGKNQVSPGMTAEVDLVIGKRTILSYLTDRLQQTAAEAFGEN
jgi:adhesin transport system membrane fusion protein